MKNKVFIATSIDGYIAGKNNDLSFLESVPNPDKIDMGYSNFTASIDALVMGRTTFEVIDGFGIDWPYTKPVFVLSRTLKNIPKKYEGKVFLLQGSLSKILEKIHAQGFKNLYIDGGTVIQNFLAEDLIDEMTITTIPIILGSGVKLFGELKNSKMFSCVESKIFLDSVIQNRFVRTKINN